MHPAFSVIFLTTLIGAGQGLFLALFTGQFYSLANLIPAQDSISFYALGSFIVLVLLGLGLFASFFHLGHPERAWRAISQWRTSWLSREVIVLPAFMLLVFVYGISHYLGWNETLFVIGQNFEIDPTIIIGVIASLMAFVLFVCTAMIYGCVKFIEEWHHWLTIANFTLLGIASGFMLAAAFSAYQGVELVAFFGTWAAIFMVLALVTRLASLYRNATMKHRSTLQTAIGVRHTTIIQKAQGFMGGSFNTREFFHGKSQATLRFVKFAFLLLVFIVPVILLAIAYTTSSATLPIAAFVVMYIGLVLERWYFFAEARHPQNLYYQSMA
ncbi:MAG: dimethyl sulfoxide reductase anchor subunit [Gammaproteobacteria bacterium]|jgi:sulfite dehydrogenase (quinone) subunit SoeC